MKRFGIVEVGSSTTKGYGYSEDKIEEKDPLVLKLKENYKIYGKFLEEDKKKLYQYVNDLKEEYGNVEVVGTSFFRNITDEDRKSFSIDFFCNTGIDFEIISQEEENEYIVYGAVANIKHSNKIAVLIGGGSVTEIVIAENGKIIEKAKSNFGTMDMINKYPDLKEDIVTTDYELMVNECKSALNFTENKAEILLLAGGNYIMFYEKLHYPLKSNIFYIDENEPYYLEKNAMEAYDYQYLYKTSLNSVKEENANTKVWWDGTRGMRLCIKAVVDSVDAKFIIPTKATMVYGIIDKMKKER
ncbi:MAG: hypothetical protein Q4D02_05390 [Clostridia bacterium]|nr:hypothetical protein [Clostridia bacterium]